MRPLALACMGVCLGVALGSTPAHAHVAVAVTIAEEDASQRDIAGKVVSVARKHWRMLQPQLTTVQTKTCPAGDTECLRNLAAQAKADHLLVVGVAPLGVRDRVVAVQLFNVTDPRPLFEESVVQSGLNEDLTDVKALAARLVAAAGPAPYTSPPPFVPAATTEPTGETGPWSVAGYVLVGAGVVTAGASALTGWGLVEAKNPAASNVLLVGIAAGGALAAVGALAFVVDGF